MKYPKTTFSSYNQRYENGAKEYIIWRKLAPGNEMSIGVASKTKQGTWEAYVTSRSYKTITIEEPSFSKMREHVLQFVET